MAPTTRPARAYRPGLLARLADGLRYGGGLGQWSWLVHRLTGLGILFFLIVHILDTFFVVFAPGLYDHTVAIYGGIWPFDNKYYPALRWAFRIAELGLIACVVFHAINGVGVILYDFWHRGSLYRREILRVVQVVFWLIMIPTAIYVLYPLSQPPGHLNHGAAVVVPSDAASVPIPSKPASSGSPIRTSRGLNFMLGSLGVAAIWVGVLSFVPPKAARVRPAGGYELMAWRWMRISGLLLVFLAVGHLFIMHILNNVETINYAFIADRWADPRTGFIWRLWDFAMISLAVWHGFNGLRQVLFEYVARPGARVWTSTLTYLATVTLIGIGSYAIFMFEKDVPYYNANPPRNRPPAARAAGLAPRAEEISAPRPYTESAK